MLEIGWKVVMFGGEVPVRLALRQSWYLRMHRYSLSVQLCSVILGKSKV